MSFRHTLNLDITLECAILLSDEASATERRRLNRKVFYPMYPNRDFSKATIAKLAKRGITVVSSTMVADAAGSFANAEVGYILDNNGESQIRLHGQVLALAA